MDNDHKIVIVVGAGISGLTAAYELLEANKHITVKVLEASSQAGGVIATTQTKHALVESGPESFVLATPSLKQLIGKLGIENRLITAREENKGTYVAFQDKLHILPDGFTMFAPAHFGPLLTTSLFSLTGKLRMALDVILPAQEKPEESLAQFVRRRLGKQALERLAEPLISGIYGGNPEYLSANAVVPKLVDIEKQHGSIIRGLWQQPRSSSHYSMFASFDRGMKILIEALEARLPKGGLMLNCPIEKILFGQNGKQWDVICQNSRSIAADAVIICTPATSAGQILNEIDCKLADDLKCITYSSTVLINSVYQRADIKHVLNGFGFVAPYIERTTVRACSFSSSKFKGRVSSDKVLLRIFVGGNMNKDHYNLSDNELQKCVADDLKKYLGVKANPVMSITTRHSQAIPQYNLGHKELVARIESRIAKLGSLALAGNAYNGVNIGQCVANGQKAAQIVLESLRSNKTPITPKDDLAVCCS